MLPGAVEMKANTAVGFLLSGTALLLLTARARRQQYLGQILGLAVVVLGLVTLAELRLGWWTGAGELLFLDPTGFRGRMSVFSALVFIAVGLGLGGLPWHSLRWLVRLASVFALLVGGISLVGYLWHAGELITGQFLPPLAVNTAASFILLGAGLLLATRDSAQQNPTLPESLSTVEKRTLAGFLGTMGLLLLSGGLTYRATVVGAESARMVAHTQQVRAVLGKLFAAISDAETQQRNYLLDNRKNRLESYQRNASATIHEVEALVRLVEDNPAQTKRAERLRSAVVECLALLQRTTTAFEQAGLAAAQELIRGLEDGQIEENIRAQVAQMDNAEEELLTSREILAAHRQSLTLLSLLGTLTVALFGLLVLFRGIRREMAHRNTVEKSLRRSEESLAVTLHSIGDAVLATDTRGTITRMNIVAEKLTGWPLAEALGRPVAEVFRILNERTREPAIIPVNEVLESGEIHGLANHTVIIARDGTERPIADSAAPIRETDGRVVGVALVFRDVTEEQAALRALRESETRYRSLFESIDEGYCIIEMIFNAQGHPVDYRFLELSPSFEKQTGLRGALGKRMRELAPNHEAHWFETYGGIAMTGAPVRFQSQAAQLNRWYDVYAFRFGDPVNRQVAILFNDITGRKQSEKDILELNQTLEQRVRERTLALEQAGLVLRQSEEVVRTLNSELERRVQDRTHQLEAANQELESFSYSVSHDLRAPLRHIQGYVELLERATEGRLTEEARRYLRIITESSVEMGRLIDDLLAFSRMGKAEFRESEVQLDAVVQAALRSLEMAIRERNIEWQITPLPAVTGDAAMLRQVFANLLGNAIKYSRQRNPAKIEVGCTNDAQGQVVIFVRDNGSGFDMRYAHKLFGVFQRLHRAEEFEGTGIGLAIVRRIILRHGGRTWAEGALNQGATFFFTLKPATPTKPT